MSGAVGIRVNGEEQAVGLAVAEALALRVGFAGGATGGEGVLGARRVEVVRGSVFSVANNSTSWSRGTGWC